MKLQDRVKEYRSRAHEIEEPFVDELLEEVGVEPTEKTVFVQGMKYAFEVVISLMIKHGVNPEIED